MPVHSGPYCGRKGLSSRSKVRKKRQIQISRRFENDVLRMHPVKIGLGDLLAPALLITDKSKYGWPVCKSKGKTVKNIRTLAPAPPQVGEAEVFSPFAPVMPHQQPRRPGGQSGLSRGVLTHGKGASAKNSW